MLKAQSIRIWINDISVRNKLLLLYIFCVLVPIILTNSVFCYKISKTAKEQVIESISIDIGKIQNDFKKIIDEIIVLSHSIYTDKSLNGLLERDYKDSNEYYTYYIEYLRSMRERYIHAYQSINDINIYTDNPGIPDSAGYLKFSEEIEESEWYHALQNSQGQILVFSYISQDYDGPRQVFSVIRRLNHHSNKNKYNKVLKIDLQFKVIAQIIESRQLDGKVILVNDKNKIVYSNDEYKTYGSNNLISFEELSYEKKDFTITESLKGIVALNHWKIVGVFSHKKVWEIFIGSIQFVIKLALLNLCTATLIIYLISRSFHYRIGMLSKHMIKVRNENFEAIKVEGKDEIGQLIQDYNRMITRIKELIHDVYIADIQKKNLELERKQAIINSLQSQINPHFLFNTLETIRMRSLSKNENETAQIIKHLSKIFRQALAWSNDWIIVKEEVEITENFLKIQQYRFGNKIDYVFSIDEQAKDCKIPKMIIQPFIENASIHGIEKIKGKGTIWLDVKELQNTLYIIISDNGPGIKEERLTSIIDKLEGKENTGGHIGIVNVYRRLHLYYGEDFKFSIESCEKTGTKISITIPARNASGLNTENL